MLTANLVPSSEKVIADRSLRGGEFQCPKCRDAVTLKAGDLVVAHFAHRVGTICDWGGESMEHAGIKRALYDQIAHGIAARSLHDRYRVEMEKDFGFARPDVWLEDRTAGTNLAIEIQASPITPELVAWRTQRYRERAFHVLWMVPFDDSRLEWPRTGEHPYEFRLKAHERIISQMAFNTLACWTQPGPLGPGGLTVMKLCETRAPFSEFRDSNGDYQSFDGRRRKMVKGIVKVRSGIKLGHLAYSSAREYRAPGMSYALPDRLVMTYDWRKDPAARAGA